MIITNDIQYIGVNDHKVDLFEGQYIVPNGMAYNSYAILDEKIAVKVDDIISNVISGFISDTININGNTLVDVYIYSTNDKRYSKIAEKVILVNELSITEPNSYDLIVRGSESQLSNIDFGEYAKKGFANLLIVANGESFRYNGYKEVNISEFKKLYDDYKKTFVSRSVPLKVNPLTDKEIKEIKTDVNKVVIKGPKDIIDDIEFIEVSVDAYDIDKSKKYKVSPAKPNGVEVITPSSVEIEVILEDEE